MADRLPNRDSPDPLRGAFSARLRHSTSREHAAAEATGFFRRLFQGEVTRRQYAEYLAALHQIYATLEHHLQRCHQTNRPAGRFYDPGLLRGQVLLQDINYFAPGLSPHQVLHEGPPSLQGTVHRYTRGIEEAAQADNLLLAAHAYVRYLGDLSGGPILGQCVAKLFDLPPDAPRGLHFYCFPEIPDPGRFKNHFRSLLDNLPLDLVTAQRIENEAKLAFRLNINLLESLEE